MSGRSKIAVILVLLIVGAISLFLFTKSTQQPADNAVPFTETAAVENAGDEQTVPEADTPAPLPEGEMAAQPEEITETGTVEQPAAFDHAASVSSVTIDVAAALAERRIGDTSAPVTIREYASLTCSHCGDFHKTTFSEIKAQLIDTGKASLVMSDFPLNKPALDAAMVARCLPADRYFNFVSLLFEKQADWATDANYMNFLKQNAQLAGLGAEQFDACVNNEALRNGILDKMKGEQEKYQIASTPTFVVGDKNVIQGGMPLAVFVKAVEDEIAAKNSPAAEKTPVEPVTETGARAP